MCKYNQAYRIGTEIKKRKIDSKYFAGMLSIFDHSSSSAVITFSLPDNCCAMGTLSEIPKNIVYILCIYTWLIISICYNFCETVLQRKMTCFSKTHRKKWQSMCNYDGSDTVHRRRRSESMDGLTKCQTLTRETVVKINPHWLTAGNRKQTAIVPEPWSSFSHGPLTLRSNLNTNQDSFLFLR